MCGNLVSCFDLELYVFFQISVDWAENIWNVFTGWIALRCPTDNVIALNQTD